MASISSSSSPETPDTTSPVENGKQAGSTNLTSPVKSSRARFKPQLSCTFCRNRKLKCDRNLPCQNCVKRDQSSSCTYIHSNIRDKTSHIQKASSVSNSQDVHGRIRHLEELVVSLMQSTNASNQYSVGKDSHMQTATNPDVSNGESYLFNDRTGVSGTSDSLGRMSIDDKHAYVGGSHWAAILDSIAGLKESVEEATWSQEDVQQHLKSDNKGPELLVGALHTATRPEILASIPSKHVADVLVAQYFESGELAIAVHRQTFNKEYEQFWKDPDTSPIIWIGLLYAIICLGINLQLLSEDEPEDSLTGQALRNPHQAIKMYCEKVVQCLVLGNYTEPTAYTVETLLLYSFIEYFQNSEAQAGQWMAMGITVRAAMRLGYHRDPRHYPTITAYQGEMQRRKWAVVTHLDLSTSCIVGLPRMIKEGMYDTEQPRNLQDEDFDEQTVILPPPRPEAEITHISYLISKYRIKKIFGMIMDQAHSTLPFSYGEVMKLDGLLQDAYNRAPESLRIQSLEELKFGDPDMRIRRFTVDLAFQKSRCVLHRKFLVPPKGSNASSFPYSTNSCVNASMQILSSQALMWSETRPGKTLHKLSWKTSSLMTQDFLLAAMLVCLYLNHNMNDSERFKSISQNEISFKWSRDDMVQALEGSFQIWDKAKCRSKDAIKAANALKAMLIKIRGAGDSSSATGNGSSYQDQFPLHGTPGNFAQTLWSSPSMINSSAQFQDPCNSSIEVPVGVVDDMLTDPIELNWELWDNNFQSNYASTIGPDLWNYHPTESLNPNDQSMEWNI